MMFVYRLRKALRKMRNRRKRQEWHAEIDRLLAEC